MRITWQEVSGACGDLGTFLPLTVALVRAVGLDLGTTLIVTGIYNIIVGYMFDIPLPVQPMKAICAIAIATPSTFDLDQVMAAGLFVGLCVLLLGGAANLVRLLQRVPTPVIAGMQLALGLEIATKGLKMVWGGPPGIWPPPRVGALDGPIMGVAACLFILVSVYATYPRAPDGQNASPEPLLGCEDWAQQGSRAPPLVPAALLVVAWGVVLTCICHPSVLQSLTLGPSIPHIRKTTASTRLPSWQALQRGILQGGLPQLPLTVLNSILAVAAWSTEAFPSRPVSARCLSLVLGVCNIAGALVGSLPACNGVGGLAAQAAFGATNGLAPMLLGGFKVGLGLLFGSSLFQLLLHFPESLLGALLVFAGVQLAAFARCDTRVPSKRAANNEKHHRTAAQGPRWDMLQMLLTTALCMAFKNLFVGVAGGTLVGVLVQMPGWTVEVYRTRNGGVRIGGEYRRLDEGLVC